MISKFNSLIISGLLTISALSAHAKDGESKPTFVAQEVSPGLFMLEGHGTFMGGNIALSVGEDGVVMIDDSMPQFLDLLNKEIKKIANKPVDFLINTHVHGDHTGNNKAFGEAGTHIVAHENMRKQLVEKGVKGADGKMQSAPLKSLPIMSFSTLMNFHLNGENAHIFHLPNAHTDGDAAIFFKKANAIHAGDVFFNGLFPFIDINSGGSVDGYIAAQRKILSMMDAQTKIIPGHGPLATKKDLESAVVMLEGAKSLVQKAIDSGKDEDSVVKMNPLAKYSDKWSWGFITTEKMTRQVYKSLKHGLKATSSAHAGDGHKH